MSNVLCEVDESVATMSAATSTEVVVLMDDGVGATSSLGLVFSPFVMVESAQANTTASYDMYTLGIAAANAVDLASPNTAAYRLVADMALAKDTPLAVYNSLLSASAAAVAATFYEVPQILASTAVALSTAQPQNMATVAILEDGKIRVTDEFFTGKDATLVDSIIASATAVTVMREATQTVSEAAMAQAVANGTAPITYLVFSTATASASIPVMQLTAGTLLLSDVAYASDLAWARDTAASAWVLNTESTAASWYTNYNFQSLTRHGNTTLAAGPDGLYVIGGDTDDGQPIEASVQYGFEDFKQVYEKRLDNVYFGYTSSGTLNLTLETYGHGDEPQNYVLETRAANAPRTTRVTPGKGLLSRYWRITVANEDGADFQVLDSMADLAISKRRV